MIVGCWSDAGSWCIHESSDGDSDDTDAESESESDSEAENSDLARSPLTLTGRTLALA